MIYDPTEFQYQGRRIDLTPTEAGLLELLMLRGKAPWETIDEAVRDRTNRKAVRAVVIHRIRAKFHACAAPDPIETMRKYGLALRGEFRTATKVWIGLRQE